MGGTFFTNFLLADECVTCFLLQPQLKQKSLLVVGSTLIVLNTQEIWIHPNQRIISYNGNHFKKSSRTEDHLSSPTHGFSSHRTQGKKEGKGKNQTSQNTHEAKKLVGQTFYCDLLAVKHSNLQHVLFFPWRPQRDAQRPLASTYYQSSQWLPILFIVQLVRGRSQKNLVLASQVKSCEICNPFI